MLCQIQFSRDERDGFLPGFWLPWQTNTIKKITLHDKRGAAEQLRAGAPRAFFTATVNGCSVFVHGDRQTPTVYHTNARDVAIGRQDTQNRNLRAHVLEGRIRGVEAPRRGRGLSFRALHPDQYMTGHAVDLHFEPLVATENATVFGTATTGGDWSFYCQPYNYQLEQRDDGTRKHYPKRDAFEFWPAGGGRVAIDVVPPPESHFVRERGAANQSLREHVIDALNSYSSNWQSAQSRNAIAKLRPMLNQGHATLLRAVHHYLSLDSNLAAHNHGLGARLKTDSTLYRLLMAEYRKWLG